MPNPEVNVASSPARTAAYIATGMGLAHAVLFVLGFGILRHAPKPGASDAALVEYYNGPGRRWVLVAGIYLLPLAAIAFIWFSTALRMWVARHGRPEHMLFSNIQLIAGVVYTALMLVAAAAFTVDSAVAELERGPIDPTSARNFPQFGKLVVVILAMRMAAMFVITTGSIGKHSRLLPSWFVWLSYAVGLTMLVSATLDPLFLIVFPVWILILTCLLMIRVRAMPAGAASFE